MEQLKPLEPSRVASRLIRSARTAHLATADKSGQPHVIPICFVYDGKHFYSPIDEKPKRTTNLKRLHNIAENPNVALVIDHYEEDWRRLAYLLILGRAKLLHRGTRHGMAVRRLRRKYPQYRSMALAARPLILIQPRKIISWQANAQRAGDNSFETHLRAS